VNPIDQVLFIGQAELERLYAEVERLGFLNAEERKTIEELSALLLRAADALDEDQPLIGEPVPTREVNRVLQEREALIAELRKAAQ